MVAFTSPSAASSPSPPPVGTFIHNGSLQLVEILGYGGYGIVYRAIPTNYPASSSTPPPSYAVKCLPAKRHSSSSLSRNRARDPHQHETYLHKLACSPPHPNIITLHDSVVDPYTQHTYIIMDFAPGGDLFTQILHKRAFLGYGDRIRNVFLQLIDAVERCHERGVYHRDLKPENILCWEEDETLHPRRKHSMRVALTDFGLATRDIWSKEFRTGSVYHMSPECHGPSTPTSHGATGYSPAHSDLFSLGIILLNLITGRNPWKSASPTDPTFQAYCRDPHHFLMSVLPISQEVNEVLVGSTSGLDRPGGLLSLSPSKRLPGGFAALKKKMLAIREFYSPDVVFEGGMARCGWEVADGPAAEESDEEDEHEGFMEPPRDHVEPREEQEHVEEFDPSKLESWQTEPREDPTAWKNSTADSRWSSSSGDDSEMVFAPHQPQFQSSVSWTPTPITPGLHTPTSLRFTISRSSRHLSSDGSEYSSGLGTPEPPVTPPATSAVGQGRVRLRLNTNLGPGGYGQQTQELTPASRTTLVSRSPFTLRSGVSPFATHGASPFARVGRSPYDSAAMLMEHDPIADEIEEEMRTALDVDNNVGYWMGSNDELIPIPVPLSAKSPIDQRPLPIPPRDIGYGDSFYDSSPSSSEEEEEEDDDDEDVRMAITRSFGGEVGMEFTYTTSEYDYSYATAHEAQDSAAQENRMSVLSTTTATTGYTQAANGEDNRMSIIETHNRMSVVATTPASTNPNRMSIIPTIPTPTTTTTAVPPARPESPTLGLGFLPLPSSQPAAESTQPIPIPAPTAKEGSDAYLEAEARRQATYNYLQLTNEPTTGTTEEVSPYTAPAFSFSTYPSAAPTNTTTPADNAPVDDSWTGFSTSDLDLEFNLKLTSPTSPAPLPIRPPPSPAVSNVSPFTRAYSRSRSRRPRRTHLSERKTRAGGPSTAATSSSTHAMAMAGRAERSTSPLRSAASGFLMSLSSMRLGGFRRSREGSPAATQATTGNGTKPPPPTPASSTPSTQTQPTQVHGQFSTHWTLSTSVSACAPVQGRGRTMENLEVRRRRRLRSPFRDWFSPGKLLAAVLPSSPS